MLDLLKGFNDQKGRFNRYKYWIHTLIMQVVLILLGILITYIFTLLQIEKFIQVTSFLVPLGMIYIGFTSTIKRLHDLDKSGWMSLLLIIPLVNIYLFVICGFFKGTSGKNKYGEDPLGGNSIDSTDTPNEL